MEVFPHLGRRVIHSHRLGFNARLDGRPKLSLAILNRLIPKLHALTLNNMSGPARGWGPEDRCVQNLPGCCPVPLGYGADRRGEGIMIYDYDYDRR